MKDTFIELILGSLRNDSFGYSQRKIAIAGILTTVIISNILYIINCYEKNLFDGTFISWQITMIGFISATFLALYGTKSKQNIDESDKTNS